MTRGGKRWKWIAEEKNHFYDQVHRFSHDWLRVVVVDIDRCRKRFLNWPEKAIRNNIPLFYETVFLYFTLESVGCDRFVFWSSRSGTHFLKSCLLLCSLSKKIGNWRPYTVNNKKIKSVSFHFRKEGARSRAEIDFYDDDLPVWMCTLSCYCNGLVPTTGRNAFWRPPINRKTPSPHTIPIPIRRWINQLVYFFPPLWIRRCFFFVF